MDLSAEPFYWAAKESIFGRRIGLPPMRSSANMAYGIGQSFADAGSQYYAEKLLRAFGATEIVSGDGSPYEGATFIHDFNNPLPEEITDQYDTVFDGGSLEHIFNVPVALANLMKLTRVGGRLLSVNGANNMLGHGFYQFSPELLFSRVFRAEWIRDSRSLLCRSKRAPEPTRPSERGSS
jgi:hypothetical protein